MGLFDKKSNWVELGQKDFTKQVKSLSQVKQLTRLIGTAHAEASILAFWNKFASNGKAMYMADNKKGFWDALADLFQHEINCVLQGHYYLGKLQQQARRGSFHNSYATQALAVSDYGARASDSDLDKATAWIISSSNSLVKSADDSNAPVNRAKVRAALQKASTSMDIRAEDTLRYLHTQLVNQAGLRPTRGPAKEAPYPSTGGAGFLLETSFRLAQGINLPAHADRRWFDLACYLFGAVVRSHGFTDGNGRVGRGAYAAAMLTGGVSFQALKPSTEKLIHGLDNVA